jgi:exopolysaccharide production protein ExoQ
MTATNPDGAGLPAEPKADSRVSSAVSAAAYFSPDWWAVLLALAVIQVSFHLTDVFHFEGFAIYATLLATIVLVRRAPEASALAVLRWAPSMSFAILAVLSVLWSDAPGLTLRLGLMLMFTLISAIIMADRLTPSQFMGATFLANTLVILGSLTSKRYNESTDGVALAGWAGSKNVLAYICEFGILAAIAVALDRGQPRGLRLMAAFVLPIAVVVLLLAKSAGALVATVMGVGLLLGMATFSALRPQGRVLIVAMFLIIGTPVALNWPTLVKQAQDFQVNVLKKDMTFTGRTYLWERAQPIIQTRPLLGRGFGSFWREGQLDAEGLWRHAGVRGGFNFHNDFVEAAVALGYVGMATLIFTMVLLAAPLILRMIADPSVPIAFYTVAVFVMYIRTGTETGLITYWSSTTILLFAAGISGWRGRAPRRRSRLAPAPRRPAAGR